MASGMRALVLIAISSLILSACSTEPPTPARWRTATPRPIVRVSTPNPSDPASIPLASIATISAIEPTATIAPTPTDLFTANFAHTVLTGTIYDVARGINTGLSQAQIEWHFAAPELREFDGRTTASSDGHYLLRFHLRPTDEVALTVSAPGYLPRQVRLHGAEISQYGSHLDFGLITANEPAPTLPGDLGTVDVRGIVYNASRGVKAGIAAATVRIEDQSVVRPDTEVQVTTSVSGTFTAPLMLHTTDEIKITITANGFISTTLTRRANDLINRSPLLIALRPATKS